MIYYHERRRLHNGRGFNRIVREKCTCGDGIFDTIKSVIEPAVNFVKDNKELLKGVGEAVGSVATISKNTKDIIDSIRSKSRNENLPLTQNEQIAFEHKKVKDIIKRINNLNTTGSGFAMI